MSKPQAPSPDKYLHPDAPKTNPTAAVPTGDPNAPHHPIPGTPGSGSSNEPHTGPGVPKAGEPGPWVPGAPPTGMKGPNWNNVHKFVLNLASHQDGFKLESLQDPSWLELADKATDSLYARYPGYRNLPLG